MSIEGCILNCQSAGICRHAARNIDTLSNMKRGLCVLWSPSTKIIFARGRRKRRVLHINLSVRSIYDGNGVEL